MSRARLHVDAMNARSTSFSIGVALLFWWAAGEAHAQCADNNTLYNVNATPPCPGSTTVGCVWGGEYVLVNVVAGNTYTFSTCGAAWDTQITLYNNAGGGSLGYNDDGCGLQSTITWTATFTGQLRVLVDQYPCTSNFICAGLTVSCTPGTLPAGDCIYYLNLFDSFGDGWGTSNVGVSINGGPYQYYSIGNPGSSNSIPIGVNIGDVIVLNYNNSGAWQGENSYTLTLGGGGLFNSGTPPVGGLSYAGTVTCTPPPSPPEDCVGAITICNNQSFNNNTTSTGNTADLNPANYGCLATAERQGTWYVFSPSASGSIGFNIDPVGPDDYDFAIWGPYPPGSTPGSMCPPAAQPIRCSFASGPSTFAATGDYTTGMAHPVYSPPQFDNPGTTYSETPAGDGWVPGINVIVDQVYLLYISNWDQTGLAFSLSWNLANGASLDCTQLGAELLALNAEEDGDANLLKWTTGSEHLSSHFTVERSADGRSFEPVGLVSAQGNSNVQTDYEYIDRTPLSAGSFYRLQQVDQNGSFEYSNMVSVIRSSTADLLAFPNPASASTELLFRTTVDGSAQVQLLDSRGSIVLAFTKGATAGVNRFVLDLVRVEPGPYLVRILTADGAVHQGRLVRFR
ncbi:MAG: T9SS type A sorting domain-containing protein [Flavobacteriales bacterium]|nr:T9SS type A sorting domain-containing protein [Flavobacteriales bacterium]